MNENGEKLRKNLQRAEQRIQKAVCPIYGIDNRDRPYLIGSSVLLKSQSRSFLVTAAHVLDANQETTLYVGGEKELVQLAGPSHRVLRPIVGRQVDQLDFGFIEISETAQNQWSQYTFLTPSDLDVDDIPISNALYAFVGYPETKNKARPGRNFRLSTTAYVLSASKVERYGPLQLNPIQHFLGEFDREKQIDSEGGTVTAPDPHGISGGGVWRLGRPNEFADGSNVEKLIGIGIEHRRPERALLAVRISLVVAALTSAHPELAQELPKPRKPRVVES